MKNVLDFELDIGIDLRENSNKSITKTLSLLRDMSTTHIHGRTNFEMSVPKVNRKSRDELKCDIKIEIGILTRDFW